MEMLPPWNHNRQGNLHGDGVNAQLMMLYQSEANLIANAQNRQVSKFTDSRMLWDTHTQPMDTYESNNYEKVQIKNESEPQQSSKMDTLVANTLTPSPQAKERRALLWESLAMSGSNSLQMRFNALTPPGLPPNLHSEVEQNHHQDSPQRDSLPIIETPPLDDSFSKSPNKGEEGGSKDPSYISNEDKFDSDAFYKPQYNSHGKIRTYKCKNCDFIAITKADEWAHKTTHMESGKIFKCPYPNCPFVTKHKQHFAYHEKDHQNDKPFRCDKCDYACKNKAMLTSHMKSHSAIYPYNCKTCGYATKHCHQLKLHLRKYNHEPGFVLNEDGIPDPHIVIDVNGRRRGPKRKKDSTLETKFSGEQQTIPQREMQVAAMLMKQNSRIMNKEYLPTTFSNMLQHTGGVPNNMFLPYMQMLASHQVALAQMTLNQLQEKSVTEEANNARNVDLEGVINDKEEFSEENNISVTPRSNTPDQDININSEIDSPYSNDDENSIPPKFDIESSRVTSDNERLSKSFHVENLIGPTNSKINKPTNGVDVPGLYLCKHCDIYFKDVVVYSLHMGSHSRDGAFKCNMCGDQCENAAQFFIHLARKAHNTVEV